MFYQLFYHRHEGGGGGGGGDHFVKNLSFSSISHIAVNRR